MRFLAAALERALGKTRVRIEGTSALGGGGAQEARRLVTSEGEFFAKWSRAAPPDIYVREAEGLEALRSAGHEMVIPRVIAAAAREADAPGYLILEYLAPAPRAAASDHEAFGRGLAALHSKSSGSFGFPTSSYCGSTPQDNQETASWLEFYRDRRLRPLLTTLAGRGELTTAERRAYDGLMRRLPDLLPPESTPSLIHGDLWAGNVLWTSCGPGLVDPACAFADREMEFGISTLFGGVSRTALAAYEEAWPLPAGWKDRNPIYQLYHLLNHALLFGGHYSDDAMRIAVRYGS